MQPFVAIVHNIRSMHNVGSIFRTADAVGVNMVYLTGITSAPVDRLGHARPPIAKVSLGAEQSVPWKRVVSLAAVLRSLKKQGYAIVVLEQHARARSVFMVRVPAKRPIALLLGNEVRGVHPSIIKQADYVMDIPMRGIKESLNVSVAFGIAAYALARNISR